MQTASEFRTSLIAGARRSITFVRRLDLYLAEMRDDPRDLVQQRRYTAGASSRLLKYGFRLGQDARPDVPGARTTRDAR